jgi:hypothetical protein
MRPMRFGFLPRSVGRRFGRFLKRFRSGVRTQEPRSAEGYLTLLDELSGRLPRAGVGLRQAADTRAERLGGLIDGARLAGINDLLLYLDRTVEKYETNEDLSKISFLVRRLVADFETALEATLSGYLAVATDAMRDVLEIEYLLLDFVVDPSDVDLWLSGTQYGKFLPRELRKRLRAAGVAEFTSSVMENADYKAHSAALHVSPRRPVIGDKGRASDPFELDAGFWEVFEHARRVLLALEACGLAIADEAWTEQSKRDGVLLDRIADAHSRTQEMQAMYIAMITGPDRLRERLGREPTTHELLVYVRDEFAGRGA